MGRKSRGEIDMCGPDTFQVLIESRSRVASRVVCRPHNLLTSDDVINGRRDVNNAASPR